MAAFFAALLALQVALLRLLALQLRAPGWAARALPLAGPRGRASSPVLPRRCVAGTPLRPGAAPPPAARRAGHPPRPSPCGAGHGLCRRKAAAADGGGGGVQGGGGLGRCCASLPRLEGRKESRAESQQPETNCNWALCVGTTPYGAAVDWMLVGGDCRGAPDAAGTCCSMVWRARCERSTQPPGPLSSLSSHSPRPAYSTGNSAGRAGHSDGGGLSARAPASSAGNKMARKGARPAVDYRRLAGDLSDLSLGAGGRLRRRRLRAAACRCRLSFLIPSHHPTTQMRWAPTSGRCTRSCSATAATAPPRRAPCPRPSSRPSGCSRTAASARWWCPQPPGQPGSWASRCRRAA